MKSLMKPLKESIFNNVDDIVNDDTVLFEQFLKDNYQIDGTYIIKNSVIDVMGDVRVKNKNIESLTNGLFRFGKVDGGFFCSGCENLKSLEGAPKEVGRDFSCDNCSSLKSLNGAPKKVGGDFVCGGCPKLKSLEGASKEVGGNFSCAHCWDLKSLEGAPEKVGGVFYCSYCSNLTITDEDNAKYNLRK